MKKFVFTLEKVLNVKNQLHEVKRNELMQLQLQKNNVLDAIEANQREFEKYNSDVNQIMQSGTTSSSIESYKRYFTFLNNREKQLQLDLQKAERAIEDKQQEIIEIKTEISGLEKLKEKQLAEYNKALQKQQELEIEEFISEKISGTT